MRSETGTKRTGRFKWERALRDARKRGEIPRGAAYVALMLGTYMRGDTGHAWPSQRELAEATGYSRSQTVAHLNWLVENGWLWREPGGGVYPTHYYAALPFEKEPSAADTYALEDAGVLIEDALRDGPQPEDEIKRRAERAGIPLAVLDRARKLHKVRAYPTNRDTRGERWYWELPPVT